MLKKKNLPLTIPIFPLSNFIIFPKTTVPLNIFEPKYVKMVNDCMKTNRIIGLIQPRSNKIDTISDLHNVGCLGKITNFKDVGNRYLIELSGISRFNITEEIKNSKLYREFKINFDNYHHDLNLQREKLDFLDLDIIFKNFKLLFQKKGYIINWKSLEKQNVSETLNALAMASPFSLEEKQILLESQNLEIRKNRIAEILTTYNYDDFDNSTIQ